MSIKKTTRVISMMSKLEDVTIYFTDMRDALQRNVDDKSEKWQESEKGQEAFDNLSKLDDIVNGLEQVAQDIDDVFEEE